MPCVTFNPSVLLYLSNHCGISTTFLQMTVKTTLLNLPFELKQPIWEEVIGHHKYLHIRLLHSLDVRSSQRLKHFLGARNSPEPRGDKALPKTGCSIPIHVGDLNFRNDVPRVSLKFLQTCHQVHGKAERLVYTTTTVSFDRPTPLWDSGAALTTTQKWSLHEVHLSIKSDVCTDRDFHGHSIVLSAMAMLYGL